MDENGQSDWYDDYAEGKDDLQIDEYDITASPNDFNVMTLCSFIDSGSVRIPGFQRNFVWDLGRASRLIESLILGLPGPTALSLRTGTQQIPCDRWSATTHVDLLLRQEALSKKGKTS